MNDHEASALKLIFREGQINQLTVQNRVIRSATHDGKADNNGMVTNQQIESYEKLAKGGVGLIISGIASVHPDGAINPHQLDISSDKCIEGLRRLVKAVHKYDTKIAVQLCHAGRESARHLSGVGLRALAPSLLKNDPHFKLKYKEINSEKIDEIINSFTKSAKRAISIGFDAVQIHGAHAFLISQFLSPFTNRRNDIWGGNLKNRFRLLEKIYTAIRQEVGTEYPLMIKLGVEDGFPEGLKLKEGLVYAKWCEQIGFDAIEVSQGLRGTYFEQTEFRTGIDNFHKEGYFRAYSKGVKKAVDIPVIMVGGLRSPILMERLLKGNEADYVSLCRPFIRQPNLVKLWRENGPSVAECISCNACYTNLREKGLPLRCVFEVDNEREKNDN